MSISNNKKYQYFLFFILSISTLFNGGNSNLFIQINFVLLGILFLQCKKNKNYNLHLRNFLQQNNLSLIFYFLFIIYLLLQIVPLPIEFLKFMALEKYNILNSLNINIKYSSISLSYSDSFFQILNYLSIILIIFILKMIFFSERHKRRLYIFLSFLGFLSSLVAVMLYLLGNPEILFFKNEFYKDSSTGFFINRTVFSIFLLFCFLSSIELLKNFRHINSNSEKNLFFDRIYIRLFLMFITIGIITSFSRIGNFLLLFTITFYLLNEIFVSKKKDKTFIFTILLIVFFDLLIFGFYFGATELINRFYFLDEELSTINNSSANITRGQIIIFSFNQLNEFLFFGYGSGAYETMFQLKFLNSDNKFADHAHSDIIEFFGEFGLVGFIILFFSVTKFFSNIRNYTFTNSILFFYLIIILLFDFSLHIPLIQMLFIIFFSISNNSNYKINFRS